MAVVQKNPAETTVTFIGLGVMGRPMAVNLHLAGFNVVAHTRSSASRERGRDAGLTVVESVGELPSTPDIVITMLPDAPDVRAVLTEYAPRVETSSVFVDMSTIAPGAARDLGAELVNRGHRVLDAPVSGGEAGAIEGALSIMIGGDAEVVDEVYGALEALGTTIVHVGPSGAGQVVKAANQLIVAANIQALAEALTLIEAQGVKAGSALDVLAGGLAGSTVLQRKRAALENRDYTPGFRLELHQKDLGIVADAAREVGVPLPSGAVVSQLVRALVARGDGALDHSALFKLQQELSGRSNA
ncbi:MAG: NAD(P)-dependent oxidoreductase [Pseudoclavibacter sp.]